MRVLRRFLVPKMASEKDKFEMEKRSEDHLNYQTSAHSAQWQIGDPSVSTCQGPSASLVSSFSPGLWNHPTNAQSFGFGVANANASATGSGIGKPVPIIPRLDMGGGLSPVGPNVLPPSLSHFHADSAFIERAARFSCFNGGSYTGILNPSANSESLSPYSNTPKGSPRDSSVGVVNCENVMENQRDKDSLGLSNNESDEPINLGSASGDSSSRDLSTKRKKRTIQDMELVPAEGTSPSPTEGVTNNANGKQKAERNSSTMVTARSSGKQPKDSSEAPKEDYIHVRARRGQATNSHSLAERVRREKISERMKYLQDLVPGCSKVTGKAVMLDEIINYVQSLQRQVEFLSMKLATVNPRLDFNIEGLLAKDFLHSRDGSSSTMGFSHDMISPHSHLAQPGLVPPGMSSMPYPSDALRRALSAQLTMMSAYKEPTPQMPNAWDDEIQNVYQMNFGTTNPPLNSQELSDTPRDGFSN